MQFACKYLFSVGTFAAALVLTGSHAWAQRVTFTLPFEAHVGNTTLQPGEYKLRLPVGQASLRTLLLEGNGKMVSALPMTTDSGRQSQDDYFEFVNVDGTYFAIKFVSGATGTVYEFRAPKAARAAVLAKARVTGVAVKSGAPDQAGNKHPGS